MELHNLKVLELKKLYTWVNFFYFGVLEFSVPVTKVGNLLVILTEGYESQSGFMSTIWRLSERSKLMWDTILIPENLVKRKQLLDSVMNAVTDPSCT